VSSQRLSNSSPIESARPENIRFERQFGPCSIEDLLRRAGNSVDIEVLVHDQENVKISGRRFRSDKTTPDEHAAELPRRRSKVHYGPKAD
jgi:hypothetical protein